MISFEDLGIWLYRFYDATALLLPNHSTVGEQKRYVTYSPCFDKASFQSRPLDRRPCTHERKRHRMTQDWLSPGSGTPHRDAARPGRAPTGTLIIPAIQLRKLLPCVKEIQPCAVHLHFSGREYDEGVGVLC